MDERYERVPYRFGSFSKRMGSHPGLVVGENRLSLLVVPITHERKRSRKSSNRKFNRNPNGFDPLESYWETRLVVVPRKEFQDTAVWSLSKEDEEKIDGFLRGNGKAKLHFQ